MTEAAPYGGAGLPLTATLARRIIAELLEDGEPRKRKQLADKVEELHLAQGGKKGTQDATAVVKKALQMMASDGVVTNAMPGYWQAAGANVAAATNPTSHAAVDSAPDADDEIDDDEESSEPEKEIGTGHEVVYLYYNPNDRELAQLKGKDVWECKIGLSTKADAKIRILGQGAKTALSHPPVIGLVIRTDDSAALEKAIHASLRLEAGEVEDCLGTEWFMTSPERVEAWYADFEKALIHLRVTGAGE